MTTACKKYTICFLTIWMTLCLACSVQAGVFPGRGIYEICPAGNEAFVLDAVNCTEQDRAYDSVQLYRALQVKQQEFYLEFVSEHGCRIVNLETGLYLTEEIVEQESAEEEKQAFGSAVFAEKTPDVPEGEKDLQLWHLVSRDNGAFLIGSAHGLYLTIAEGRAFNGAGVDLEPSSGKPSQNWLLREVPVYGPGAADTDVVNPYLEDGSLQDVQVSVRINSSVETLTAQTLAEWMTSPDGHTLTFDESRLREYVSGLAKKYNTVGQARRFVTSYKVPITLYKGNFGWKMDEEEVFSLLKEAVNKPGRRTVIPSWSQKGGDRSGVNTDIGDSYVEIDLNAQKVWLYKEGKQLLETDCVSGTAGTERETPGGVYYIFYKQAPAVLRGADYESPVNYWMPFNGNIGLHDAPWRGSFGGEIYKTNGSHGCVNLPYEAAKIIYETCDIGYPVVCYH